MGLRNYQIFAGEAKPVVARLAAFAMGGSRSHPFGGGNEQAAFVEVFNSPLNIQVLHFQRVFFNELAAGFDDIAHEDGEDGVSFHLVFDAYLKQGALFGVHGSLPELVGIHFAEALESLHGEGFFAEGHHVLQQFLAALDGQLVAIGSDVEGRLVIGVDAAVKVQQAALIGG